MSSEFSQVRGGRVDLDSSASHTGRPGVVSLLPQDLTPDYQTARRYLVALQGIDMDLASHRQQVVLTNDVEAASQIIANYILKVKPLIPPDDSFFAQVSVSLQLSNEELFTGPDPRRSAPRQFKEVVQFEYGSPEFSALVAEIAKGRAPEQYRKPREIDYLMDREYSDLFVDFFEARANQTLFIGKLRPPADPAAAHAWLDQFAYQHYRLQHQEGDYADVLYKVPQIVWVAPFAYTQPLAPFWTLSAATTPLLTVPYHEWFSCADGMITPRAHPGMQDAESDARFAIYTNRLKLYAELMSMGHRLQRLQEKTGATDAEMQVACSLTSVEWQFLTTTNFEFEYLTRNPESPWHPEKSLPEVLRRLGS